MAKKNRVLVTVFWCLTVACGSSQSTLIVPSDRRIVYEGRIIMLKDAAELIWPGTSIKVNFEGTEISGEFQDQDSSNYYNVLVDGSITQKIHPDALRKKYLLASHLTAGKHTMEIFKRTEWDKGKTWFYGFILPEKGVMLDPPQIPTRKMEFFGNSITCGYAIEDRVGDSPTGYYENNYDSYAAITARHFDAQSHYTAKSGIGIMISWFPLIMPEMYDRTDPTDSDSKWDFSRYVPDLVIINLLQNDAWLTNNPQHAQFKQRFGTVRPTEDFMIQSYRDFVRKVRQAYPKAQIICMLGNMDITRKGSPWPEYVQKAVDDLHDSRIFTLFVPFKETSGHPKTEEQKAMADTLIAFIDQHIKW
jgi:hypothetical protein